MPDFVAIVLLYNSKVFCAYWQDASSNINHSICQIFLKECPQCNCQGMYFSGQMSAIASSAFSWQFIFDHETNETLAILGAKTFRSNELEKEINIHHNCAVQYAFLSPAFSQGSFFCGA